jgi:hypothetical protein
MDVNNSPQQEWPDLLTSDQAVEYYKNAYNIETTRGTLAVKRSQGRGLPYKKIFGRIYYCRRDIDGLVSSTPFTETSRD